MKNVQKRENYNQVCVVHGLLLKDGDKDYTKEFVKFIEEKCKVRVQFLEEIKTRADLEHGESVEGTGGRNDVFFAVHDEDVGKFAIPRFQLEARWIEDVLAECNYKSPIYPKRVFDYCIWNKEYLSDWKDK